VSAALRAFAPLGRRIAAGRPEPIKEDARTDGGVAAVRVEGAAVPAVGGTEAAPVRDLPTWISAQELARVLDVTKQRANQILAPIEKRFSRKRAGRGGPKEFLRTMLPPELQRKIERYYGAPARPEIDERALAAQAQADPAAQARSQARADLLAAFARFCAERGLGPSAGGVEFCRQYESLPIDAETRRLIPKIAEPTLRKWRRAQAEASATAPATRKRGRKSSLTPEVAEFLGAAALERRNQISAENLGRLAQAQFDLPPAQRFAVRRWLSSWRKAHRVELTIALNPDAARSRYMPAFGRADAGVEGFLDLVELDGSPSDFLFADGAFQLLLVIDVKTRIWRGLFAQRESGAATTLLLARFMHEIGVPRVLRTDNGAAFKSRRVRAFLTGALHVEIDHVPPYSGWKKPFVEALVRRVQHGFAELAPGFKGHNVAERQALRALPGMAGRRGKGDGEILGATLTRDEAQQWLDRYALAYAAEPHRGLGGKAPNQALQERIDAGETARRIGDLSALALLMGDEEVRVVGKSGIALDGALFIADVLGALVGSRVAVRRHWERDRILVSALTDAREFICVARATHALAPEEQRAIAIDAGRIGAKARREIRAGARALKRFAPPNPLALRLKAEPPGTPEIDAVEHSTPALEAAAEAARAAAGIEPARTAPNYDEWADMRRSADEFIALARCPRETWSADDRRWLWEIATHPGSVGLSRFDVEALALPVREFEREFAVQEEME
jgi:putative transposase